MRTAGVVALWLTLAIAAAHAYLVQVAPGDDGVLTSTPSELTLRFSMGVESRFSTFAVYRLDVADDALPVDPAAPTDRERQRLNALAAQLTATVLAGERGADDPARVDDGVVALSEGNAAVTIDLGEHLPDGVYVVVWEVLAVDAHWTSGHELVFVTTQAD